MAEPARDTRMLAGIAAAAVALGITQLVAVAFGPHADARTAVGSAVIDLTPGPVKEWAIQNFGTADKLTLSVLVLGVIALVAAVSARWESRRVLLGSAAIVIAGVVGCAAVLSRAGAAAADVVPTVVGTVCGVAVLRLLVSGRFTDAPAQAEGSGSPDRGRRLSLVTLGFVGAGALSGVGGVVLTHLLSSVSGDRTSFVLPRVKLAAPPVPPTVQPRGVALPSFVTSNADFYRIDTALSVPQLARADWQLKIHGMVDREITFHFEDLDRFDVVEKLVTLTCVSNPVGGDLISNASWTGYRIRDLLADAGVHPDADMVLSMSIDGFTAGTPVEALTDDREALLAIGMNGQPLPDCPRLPRPAGRPWAVRLCVGDQMGRGPGVDAVRQGPGVLDAAGLVGARADQDGVANRCAPRRARHRLGTRRLRRCRMGTAPWRAHGRGPHRQCEQAGRLATGRPGRELLQRHLEAVELRLAGRRARPAHHHRAGYRQHGGGADVPAGRPGSRRREWLAHRVVQRQGCLTAVPGWARAAHRRGRRLGRGGRHLRAAGQDRPHRDPAPRRRRRARPHVGRGGGVLAVRRTAAAADRGRLGGAAVVPAAAANRSLTVARRRRRASARSAQVSGKGSQARRAELVGGLFSAATAAEQTFLRRLLGGELRQGALVGVMADAVAKAADVPPPRYAGRRCSAATCPQSRQRR